MTSRHDRRSTKETKCIECAPQSPIANGQAINFNIIDLSISNALVLHVVHPSRVGGIIFFSTPPELNRAVFNGIENEARSTGILLFCCTRFVSRSIHNEDRSLFNQPFGQFGVQLPICLTVSFKFPAHIFYFSALTLLRRQVFLSIFYRRTINITV